RNIPVKPNSTLILNIKSKATYGGETWIGRQGKITLLNKDNEVLEDDYFFINPASPQSNSALSVEKVVIKIPENASVLHLRLGNVIGATERTILDVYEIGLHEVIYNENIVGYSKIDSQPLFVNTPPTQLFAGTDSLYQKHSKLYNVNPSSENI